MDPLAYLENLSRRPIRLGLAPLSRLLAGMNHPESRFPSIVIGGTNGKGSIAAMAASMLTAAGFRTGLYTSPHLLDARERIRIDGCMITEEDLRVCTDTIRRQLREDLTYFEFLTAIAFLFFNERKVDIAVLEVGMGGRLDATNVVSPVVSVISNISMDHRDYLGTTIEQIAMEKSGIIKKNGCCLTAVSQKRVIGILKEVCRNKRARFFRVGDEIKVRRHPGGRFSFQGFNRRYDRLFCPLSGRHQLVNAALAVGSVLVLAENGFAVKEESLRRGLGETKWEGRLEILQERPMVLVDGAHNPAGISSLCAALREEFCYRRLTVIFGVLDDKDHRAMLRRLSPFSHSLIVTRAESNRALSPETLLAIARQYHRHVIMAETPQEAMQKALAAAGRDDLICATGSLFLIGAIKRFFKGR